VRALGKHGIPVTVVVTNNDDMAQYSRWVHERHKLFQLFSRPETLLELLERQSKRWRGWTIFPTRDDAAVVIAKNHEYLSRWYRLTIPPWEVMQWLINKNLTYQAADAVGVDTAKSYGPATSEAADCHEISFPVVVKPSESHLFQKRFGKKLFVARNREELLKSIHKVLAAGLRAQIMDLIPGPDSLFYNYSAYLDRRGEPLAEFPMRKLRKDPPFFGVCRVAETSSSQKLREPTIEILRRIGWQGMANAEYKLDPRDGRYRLMEINGRCFLMHGLARRAGINYPLLSWLECAGDKELSVRPNGWQGVWLHLKADLTYALLFHRTERLGLRDYLCPYSRPKTFAVWDRGDPKPFVWEWARTSRIAYKIAKGPPGRLLARWGVQDMPL
jgi:predicted ATP-grasp superfamily ATP-dependent carboligase